MEDGSFVRLEYVSFGLIHRAIVPRNVLPPIRPGKLTIVTWPDQPQTVKFKSYRPTFLFTVRHWHIRRLMSFIMFGYGVDPRSGEEFELRWRNQPAPVTPADTKASYYPNHLVGMSGTPSDVVWETWEFPMAPPVGTICRVHLYTDSAQPSTAWPTETGSQRTGRRPRPAVFELPNSPTWRKQSEAAERAYFARHKG
jgi:hypothetical protein